MTWQLDTSAISEWTRPRRDPGVVAWLDGAEEDRLHLSAVIFGELWHGIEKLPGGRRRTALETLVEELAARFDGRVLAVDRAVAAAWGVLMRQGRNAGQEPEAIDGLVAATALVHGLTLVTRNVGHFAPHGVATLNPWAG